MTMSWYLLGRLSCILMSYPPTNRTTSTLVNCASCLVTSYTCISSSLVGTNTTTL